MGTAKEISQEGNKGAFILTPNRPIVFSKITLTANVIIYFVQYFDLILLCSVF